MTTKTHVTIKVPVTLDIERVADLLCSAFEGGSNYWYLIESFIAPANYDRYTPGEGEMCRHIDYPLNEGGALIVSTLEGDEHKGEVRWVLDFDRCLDALVVMAEKYPRHFADVINEDDDADTGDVFLQCALFGEVIYG